MSFFVIVFQSLSCVQLFATLWTAAHQASLSITNSRSSLRLTSIESVMPSRHLILCHPFSSCPQSLPASPLSFAILFCCCCSIFKKKFDLLKYNLHAVKFTSFKFLEFIEKTASVLHYIHCLRSRSLTCYSLNVNDGVFLFFF